MTSSKFKSLTDKSETLLATIRGSVLVRLQDELLPSHLVAPLESARQLNALAADSGDDEFAAVADVLTTWLGLLVTEADPISDKRSRSILDQISAVEASLLAFKGRSDTATLDVSDFVDESFIELESRGRRQSTSVESSSDDEFEIDSEMVEVFRDEAESLLQNIRSNLEELAVNPANQNALWEIRRSAHTFKGASGIVGLKKASELAHRIEDLFGRLSEEGSSTNLHIVPLLFDATECLSLLCESDAGKDAEARFDEVCQALEGIAEKKSDETLAPSWNDLRTARGASNLPISTTAPAKKTRIVRISLDGLDDLVSYIHRMVAGRPKFLGELENLSTQVKESRSNYDRLQKAAGKLDDIAGGDGLGRGAQHSFRQSAYELAETTRDAAVINVELTEAKRQLEDLAQQQYSLLEEMHQRLLRLRKVEFGTITTRLQRAVGVTCEEEGKKAEIVVENPTTEVDTQLIDLLIEPLMHLLKNAIVHGIESPEIRRMLGKNEAGRIRVRIDNRGRDVMLKVSDDGRGIAFQPLLEKAVAAGIVAEADKDQLTRRRLHDLLFIPGLTTAERLTLNAGRGVGMSIVREAVAGAGGIVELETSAQHGTTFTIIIPCADESPVPSSTPAAIEHFEKIRSRGTILIVDDSPSVRLATARLLETAGWDIAVANHGLDAIDKLRDMPVPPVAVVSDIEMPLMNGYDLLEEIRLDEALREIPVIFVSSRNASGEREKALDAGAEEYLTKPYDDKQLLAAVESLAHAQEEALVF
ncbi:MAG TPA: response regulator [Pyrinomonadaceae bacterium]|nr:response regulator [Pyrinomonadaceae bacterium]